MEGASWQSSRLASERAHRRHSTSSQISIRANERRLGSGISERLGGGGGGGLRMDTN